MSVKVEGLKELLAELKSKPQRVIDAIDADLTEGAELIEGRAKLLAPENFGLLKKTTIADTVKPLYKTVTSPEFYAPYMEFGTGKRFKANGRGTIAAQFQGSSGRGGSYEDMVKSIIEWVRKKGFASTYSVKTRKKTNNKASKANEIAAANAIALSIIRHGVHPANNGTGFFFRAYDEILPTILSNVRKSLKA